MIKRIFIAITVPVFLVLGLLTIFGSNTHTDAKGSPAPRAEENKFHLPDTTQILPKNISSEAVEYLSQCGNLGDYSLKDCMDLQDQFVREYINAHSGDYLAISNVSTMLSEPLAGAVRVNNIQSCAWRLVLMRLGSPYLTDLDKDITKTRCEAVGGVRDEASVARANELLKIIRSHRIHPIAVPQVQYDPKRDRDEQTSGE